jgi:hypothetical protein
MSILLSLYNAARSTSGHPPKNEQAFRSFVAEKGGPSLERAQITSVDELLLSERDNQPLVVFYGGPKPGAHPDVVAYEQQGVDGKRRVGFGIGMVEDVDDTRFRELVPEKAQSK